ncbi:MAG: hypothetical protein HOV70_02000 [Streptomyces sp.]|nr:hypothetical protein [Streptomyces sp.]
MESPEQPESDAQRPARAWFFFSDDLPEGELVVPILTKHGTAMGVPPGEMTPRLLQALNQTVKQLIDTGLWQPGDDDEKPEGEE